MRGKELFSRRKVIPLKLLLSKPSSNRHSFRRFSKSAGSDESGEAIIEFIVMTVALILPLMFLISSLATIQSSLYAVQESANVAARMRAQGSDIAEIETAVAMVTADFGAQLPQIEIECGACQVGDKVTVRAETSPILPLVPAVGKLREVVTVPIQVSSFSVILDTQENR